MNITIVGGGFGGIKSALELTKNKQNHITLISNNHYFQYYPALFSTATGHSYKESWVPLAEVFKHVKNVSIIEDEITKLDEPAKTIIGASGQNYTYETLILALGSVTTYFGIEGLDTYSYGIKSESEIKKLQKHLLDEMSDGSDDEANYVIIGAGPTGVELAGALGEYLNVLRRNYKVRNEKFPSISLIEASPRVLPRSSEKTSARAMKRLTALGINVETSKKVEKQTANSLIVDGKPLATQTVIWTSGVANAPFYKQNESAFTLNERGKVVVDEYMQAAENIYVIGDNAATPFAGLAQTALHDAQFVAKHIGGANAAYKPVLPPSVVPIGHHWAVFEWGKVSFGGWPGGLIRRLADLIGYHDILPIGWMIQSWRAGTKDEMTIPDQLFAKKEN